MLEDISNMTTRTMIQTPDNKFLDSRIILYNLEIYDFILVDIKLLKLLNTFTQPHTQKFNPKMFK